jgi:uncharacterized protein YaeQ
MALGSTMYRFAIELSDVDRGVYETLDLRVAQHPSESARRMVARVLAYALRYEEGIAFGRGLSSADEPALVIKNLRGEVTAWIDIGLPTAERIHRASKTGARTYVYAHKDPTPWLPSLHDAKIHARDDVEIWSLPPDLLDALAARVGRAVTWGLTITDGQLYVEEGADTLEGTPVRHHLGT